MRSLRVQGRGLVRPREAGWARCRRRSGAWPSGTIRTRDGDGSPRVSLRRTQAPRRPARSRSGSSSTSAATSSTAPRTWPRGRVPTVQEYCAGLLARAIEVERVKHQVAEVEERRGPLEGFNEIADDPDYLAEWREQSGAREDALPADPAQGRTIGSSGEIKRRPRPGLVPASRRPKQPPRKSNTPRIMRFRTAPSVPYRIDIDAIRHVIGPPATERIVPEVLDSTAIELVITHVAPGEHDPGAFLPSLRRGEPVPAARVAELLTALEPDRARPPGGDAARPPALLRPASAGARVPGPAHRGLARASSTTAWSRRSGPSRRWSSGSSRARTSATTSRRNSPHRSISRERTTVPSTWPDPPAAGPLGDGRNASGVDPTGVGRGALRGRPRPRRREATPSIPREARRPSTTAASPRAPGSRSTPARSAG